MDRGVRVCARGHHSKATGYRDAFTPNATDLERHPIRERGATLRTDTDPPTDPLLDVNQLTLLWILSDASRCDS